MTNWSVIHIKTNEKSELSPDKKQIIISFCLYSSKRITCIYAGKSVFLMSNALKQFPTMLIETWINQNLTNQPISKVKFCFRPKFLIKPGSRECKEGETIRIDCKVTGRPTPEVTFLRYGKFNVFFFLFE